MPLLQTPTLTLRTYKLSDNLVSVLDVRFYPARKWLGMCWLSTWMMSPVSSSTDGFKEFELAEQALGARCLDRATSHFDKAECLGYNPDACAGGRWHAWMLAGQFEKAWNESDCIAARGNAAPQPLWDGQDFEGKRLLIRCLHGFGDAIQFIRYAQLLRPRVNSLAVETHAELVPLFSMLPYIDRVLTWVDGSSKRFTDWNQQIEVMELPWAFRTTTRSVPTTMPYISVPQQTVEQSAELLGRPTGLRVGLVWRSSEWNPARSLPATAFANLLRIPGISFFSFQRGPAREELDLLRRAGAVHDTAQHSPGIADTAADMMNMDLIISVDTMASHLAGALGRPVWTILPFYSDWRWMLNRVCTPWYPTMKLVRQPAPGDWMSVIESLERTLCEVIKIPKSGD